MGEPRRALTAALLVASLACVACEGGGSSAPTTGPSTTASTPTSSAPATGPTGLQFEQPSRWTADPSTWAVTLSWDEPAAFDVDHYEVVRNGKTIATDVDVTSFDDDGVEPGETFRYSVRAVDAAGAATMPAQTVVKTKSPPVEDARVEGKFIAKLHITSQSNLKGGASGGGAFMTFEPACKQGPCDIDVTFSKATGSLARDHASYDGTVRASFHLHSCTGGTITETLVFHLQVRKATAFHHTWRAEKVEGSLDETASASGCLTGHIAYHVTAVLRHS
jgi:hypothetical protein